MKEILIAEAVLGRDAAEFMRSELWAYIQGRADQEISEAHEALALVSPWRRNRIRQLQNQVWRAQSLKSWLQDLVASGETAESVLEQENE